MIVTFKIISIVILFIGHGYFIPLQMLLCIARPWLHTLHMSVGLRDLLFGGVCSSKGRNVMEQEGRQLATLMSSLPSTSSANLGIAD